MNRGLFAVLLAGLAQAMPLPAAAQADLFAPVFSALQHPRCSNCHTDTAGPLQRDGRPHQPPVQRGPEGRGVAKLECTTCHKAANAAMAPGAPDWRMPKAGQATFRNRPAGEVCRSLRDPQRNGGLQPENLGQHFMDDKLIGWAWAPGSGRQAPPMPREALVAAVATWLRAGAPCPD